MTYFALYIWHTGPTSSPNPTQLYVCKIITSAFKTLMVQSIFNSIILNNLSGSLQGIYALGEVVLLLDLLNSLSGSLGGSQSSSDGSGLLLSQINRNKSLAGELLSQLHNTFRTLENN